MNLVEQIITLAVGLILLIVLANVLWTTITSLYGGGLGIIFALVVTLFFIFVVIRKVLDL